MNCCRQEGKAHYKDCNYIVVAATPPQPAVADVSNCITFCRRLNMPVPGVIENMSVFVCLHCGQRIDVFAGSGGQETAGDFGEPFQGKIPVDKLTPRPHYLVH